MDSDLDRRMRAVFDAEVEEAPALEAPTFVPTRTRLLDSLWWLGSAAAAVLAFVVAVEGPAPSAARFMNREGADLALERIIETVHDGVIAVHQEFFAHRNGEEEEI